MMLSSLRLHICICAQKFILLTRQTYKQCLLRKKKNVYQYVGDIKQFVGLLSSSLSQNTGIYIGVISVYLS